MELQYEYENESGVHRRYYPKVEFPFFCGKLPPEEFGSDRFGRDELMDSWKKSPTINLSKGINISKGETTNA